MTNKHLFLLLLIFVVAIFKVFAEENTTNKTETLEITGVLKVDKSEDSNVPSQYWVFGNINSKTDAQAVAVKVNLPTPTKDLSDTYEKMVGKNILLKGEGIRQPLKITKVNSIDEVPQSPKKHKNNSDTATEKN